MTNIDETVSQIDEDVDVEKKELSGLIKSSLQQVKKINDAYKKFFDSQGTEPSLISDIENRLSEIKSAHESLLKADATGATRVSVLNQKYDEIKQYHAELLEGDKSVKSDIEESQVKITEFCVELFGGTGGTVGKKETVNKAIEEIVSFHTDLTKTDGYSEAIERAHAEILESYEDLYGEIVGEDSKIIKLQKDISEISNFNGKIVSELTPFIEGKKISINEIAGDISQKQKEINALLSGATVKTLAQGYLESMERYGFVGLKLFHENENKVLDQKQELINLTIFLLKWIGNALVSIINYALFIFPLLLIATIFVEPETLKAILKIQSIGGSNLIGSQFILYKISVSVPLLWVSWFGQRNISQRKRMFEEYNHKLRVVQMYLHFMTTTTYKLSDKTKLENILLDVIDRNPTEVYGRDETMLDKVIELVKAGKGITAGVVDGAKKAVGEVSK